MKKILLTTLLFTAFAGYSQVKEPQKENQQSGDIIIESHDGEIKGQEKDITGGDLYEDGEPPYNFSALQVKPEFPGGVDAFKKYIINNIQPDNLLAGTKPKELKVTILFIVEKDGTISGSKILRDPGFKFGDEVLRVLGTLKTRWKPGIQDGKTVRSTYILPIIYTIPE